METKGIHRIWVDPRFQRYADTATHSNGLCLTQAGHCYDRSCLDRDDLIIFVFAGDIDHNRATPGSVGRSTLC